LLSAILNVNKPSGWTSFDVVKFVRGRCGERRVGHAGTLDPAATGVLPVLIGQATRLTEYLVDATKTYDATIELGVVTDTFDAEGDVVSRTDASNISEDAIREALAAFEGDILQAPPVYSALKQDGVPLYKRARRGETVRTAPRPVRVEKLDIMHFAAPILQLRIVCGKGFYVRSLAHDLGAALGVGGSLSGLVRSRVGTFCIEDAVDIETLRGEFETGAWRERLVAQDEILIDWRAAILGLETARRLVNGQDARLEPAGAVSIAPGDRCRAYTTDGDFVAVLRHAGESEWRPEKVFAQTRVDDSAILGSDSQA
jgi:tRNA pseudouridine55 synthase